MVIIMKEYRLNNKKEFEIELKIFDTKNQILKENPNISNELLNESIQEIIEFYE